MNTHDQLCCISLQKIIQPFPIITTFSLSFCEAFIDLIWLTNFNVWIPTYTTATTSLQLWLGWILSQALDLMNGRSHTQLHLLGVSNWNNDVIIVQVRFYTCHHNTDWHYSQDMLKNWISNHTITYYIRTLD